MNSRQSTSVIPPYRTTLRALLFISVCLLPSIALAQYDDDLIVHRDSTAPFILRDIYLDRKNVFDTTGQDIPWLGSFFNSLHAVTRSQVVGHEVFIHPGDTVNQQMLDEVERNLRALGVFSGVALKVVPIDSTDRRPFARADLQITTRDSWSTQVTGSISTGGNAVSYGGALQEVNLFGYAYQVAIGADYTNINDRGWRYTGSFLDPNIYGSHIRAGGGFSVSDLANYGELSIVRPYYSDASRHAFGFGASRFDGRDFLYTHTDNVQVVQVPLVATNVLGWYSTASNNVSDLFRWSFALSYNRTVRDSFPEVRSAFENSVGAFIGLNSLRRTFVRMKDVDHHGESLVPIGASGGAVLGKVSPHHGGFDNIFYIGADAHKAVQSGGLYGFASIEAGTGLSGKEAEFTLERVTAGGALKLGPGALTAHFRQSTVWHWPRYILKTLDNLTGLRAYEVDGLVGDNKILINTEYAAFPDVRLLLFKFGVAAFYDIGAVWDQSEQLGNTRFHSSAGIGLRITNLRAAVDNSVLRVDFAYNFDERKFTQVIISTQKAFDVFGTLETRVPAPFTP